MAAGEQAGWIAVGVLLLMLFGWFFWHTATSMIYYARMISEFLDMRSERLRRRLEFEAIHGRPPLWYRLVQRLVILLVIAGAAALVWTKFRGA
jgi:hypothetical protein